MHGKLHTWARSNPKGGSEVGGEGGYPADKISSMIRKDVSRGTRNSHKIQIILPGLIHICRCVAGIFSWRTPWPLKGYPAPPPSACGPGGAAAPVW